MSHEFVLSISSGIFCQKGEDDRPPSEPLVPVSCYGHLPSLPVSDLNMSASGGRFASPDTTSSSIR
jgi:hypothetical protein